MNALLYAINEIRNRIPNEILHEAFNIDEQAITANLTSLDDKILRKCLRKRVLVDTNLVGGIEMVVPLINVPPSFYEDHYTVYSIPPELVMNREIISALGLSAMPINSGFGNPISGTSGYGMPTQSNSPYGGGQNALMSVANRIGDAASISGVIHNAHLEIVGFNTVLVYAHYRILAYLGMRVVVENESNLNNVQPRSYKDLATLCTLGVKAYIYNKLIIPMNSGFLSGGQELGIFKSLVEEYSSAEEDYNTFLKEVWTPVAYMNDTTRYNRLLSSMLSPSL